MMEKYNKVIFSYQDLGNNFVFFQSIVENRAFAQERVIKAPEKVDLGLETNTRLNSREELDKLSEPRKNIFFRT